MCCLDGEEYLCTPLKKAIAAAMLAGELLSRLVSAVH